MSHRCDVCLRPSHRDSHVLTCYKGEHGSGVHLSQGLAEHPAPRERGLKKIRKVFIIFKSPLRLALGDAEPFLCNSNARKISCCTGLALSTLLIGTSLHI